MVRRSWGRGVAALLATTALAGALAALPGTPLPVAHARAQAPEPVRILILGDSVTQGSSGDWTWRFWLWRALQRSGVPVDFVGPYNGLYDAVRHQQGSLDYATDIQGKYPDFDRDHGARWGMPLAVPDQSMTWLMTTYRPDVVIEARGLVDVSWRGTSPADVGRLLADEVAEARLVDPGVDFVLTQFGQRWKPGVDAYNATVPGLAARLNLPFSRVVASDTAGGIVRGVDTWDGSHFSASGEVHMASGVADALAEVGVGAGAGAVPTVSNGHWGAARLTARAGVRSAELSWTGPRGIPEQVLWIRRSGTGPWFAIARLSGSSRVVGGLVAGETYDFRLQALKGTIRADAVSNVVRVVPVPPAPRRRPAAVRVAPGPQRLTVTWRPVAGATSYVVTWVGRTTGRHGTRVVKSGPLTIRGLVTRERYDVTVTARNAAGRGPSAVVRGTPRASR